MIFNLKDYIFLAIILIMLGLMGLSQCQNYKLTKTISNIDSKQDQLLERTNKLEFGQKVIADSIGKIETNFFQNVKKIKIYK